ncbi:MAG: hypothetical protein R2763_16005 [Mycobacterium sp.]
MSEAARCRVCAQALPAGADGCPRCAVDPDRAALEDLRGRILAIDAQVGQLFTWRQGLVDEYQRRRLAILSRSGPPGVPAQAPAAVSQEWSGARVRALLLWLGAALLGISAITFTAVAWSRLDDRGRAVLLLAATAAVAALPLALRRRLPMTAEAFAGLTIVLLLVDVYAVRRAGAVPGMAWHVWWAIGIAVVAGCAAALGRFVGRRTTGFAVAALLPIAAELLAVYAEPGWVAATALALLAAVIANVGIHAGGRLHREAGVVLALHAAGSWLAAAGLAAEAASYSDTFGAAVGPALAVASLVAAPVLAVRRLGGVPRALVVALAAGVPAGIVLTLAGPLLGDEGLLTTAVIAGGATMLASAAVPSALRAGTLLGGGAFALPGTVWALTGAVPGVIGPLEWLSEPWSHTLDRVAGELYLGPTTWPPLSGSWAAVGALGAIAVIGAGLGAHRRVLLGISSAAIGLLAAVTPLVAGTSVLVTLAVTVITVVSLLLAGAAVDRRRLQWAWAVLPGAAIAAVPATGWAASSAAGSVVALAVFTLAAGAAAVLARTGMRAMAAALAALSIVAFAGVTARAAGAGIAPAGFTAALAAGAVALVGVYLLRAQPAPRAAVEGVAALAVIVGIAVAASSTTWLAGTFSALVPVAVIAALSVDRRVGYGVAAAGLALCSVWAWLAAVRVGVVEAYTAPAAAAALAAGIIGWRNVPGRSWLTLGPALVLGIGPTLAIGIADDDPVRLVVSAVLSTAAVLVGALRRLQAPLCLGAAALIALGIDQWGDDLVRMPRWITLGVAGMVLMWIGATFEHRRRNWRRASEVIAHFG